MPKYFNKVNLLIIGAQKSGTTVLKVYLNKHDDIYMEKNELHFFNHENLNYDEYHKLFNLNKSFKYVGEKTPLYFNNILAPKNIYDYNKDIKLIVILRNPIERVFSAWNMETMKKNTTLSFHEFIKRKNYNSFHIQSGFYIEKLRKYWKYFSKDQIHILKNEDLKNNRVETLNNIFSFLNIHKIEYIEEIIRHKRPYSYKMTDLEKDILINIYANSIMELEQELNWDCSEWLK